MLLVRLYGGANGSTKWLGPFADITEDDDFVHANGKVLLVKHASYGSWYYADTKPDDIEDSLYDNYEITSDHEEDITEVIG